MQTETFYDTVAERALLDLVSPATIAARLGVSRAAVSNWAARESAGFPPPLDAPGIPGPVYSWRAVKRWHDVRHSIAVRDARAKRIAALREKINALTEKLDELERKES